MSGSAETPLNLAHVRACSIASWYPTFKKLTFATHFVTLPSEFLDYLRSDGIFVSDHTSAFGDWNSDSEADEWVDSAQGDANGNEPMLDQPTFPELKVEIDETLKKLGAAFPKLNFASPKDASWMTLDGSLKCDGYEQLVLLLKSSDACVAAASIFMSDPACPSSILALRQWHVIHKALEFRCFVKGNSLIGISQRDRAFYPFLLQSKNDISAKVQLFFIEKILGEFPLADYVCDVYVPANGAIKVVDFAPFHPATTDAILFSWDELGVQTADSDESTIAIRIVENPDMVPNLQDRVGGLPYDLLAMATGESPSQDINQLVDLLRRTDGEPKEE